MTSLYPDLEHLSCSLRLQTAPTRPKYIIHAATSTFLKTQILSLPIRTLVQLPMLLRIESKILWQARPSVICPTTTLHLAAPPPIFRSSHLHTCQPPSSPRTHQAHPASGPWHQFPALECIPDIFTRLSLSQYIWASAQTLPYQSSLSRPAYLKYTQNLTYTMSLSYCIYLYTTCFHLTLYFFFYYIFLCRSKA